MAHKPKTLARPLPAISQGLIHQFVKAPANSVADDQIRRNHTVQYAAYPDFRFSLLRRDFPEKYETYADIETGRWIHIRIVVSGVRAELYLDHHPKAAFIVKDMKLGATQTGGIGIWIESGTLASFRNMTVQQP